MVDTDRQPLIMLLQLVVLLLASAVSCNLGRQPPKYPDSYTIRYNLTLPYLKEVQPDGLSFDVVYARDAQGQRARIETYGGENVQVMTPRGVWQVHPRINVSVCEHFKEGDANRMGHDALPRIDTKHWDLEGSDHVHGKAATVWLYDTWQGKKHIVQRVYVDQHDGVTPLRWHMHSMDTIDGAHLGTTTT